MSLLSTFRRHVRTAGLASLLAVMSPVVSSPVLAQSAPSSTPVASAPVSRAALLPPLSSPSELAVAPHAYYIPAGAHAPGAFGSQWRLDMLLRNSAPIGTPPADIVLYAHPRGQAASPNDPSYAFAMPSGASIWIPDVLGVITNDPLAAWVEVRSTSTLSINEAYIHNLASTGDKTGSALPVFNAATLDSDQRLLREGDRVEFVLLGAARNARENNIIWNAPTSCAAVATPTLLDQLGNEIAVGAPIQIPAGAYVQQTVDEAVGTTVALGHVLRNTIRCEQGSTTPLQAWNGVTQINTLNPQYQDSIVLQGTKYALLDAASFTTLPSAGEVNDTFYNSTIVKSRTGSVISSVGYDWNSDGQQEGQSTPGNGTNTFEQSTSFIPAEAGSLNPTINVVVNDNGQFYVQKIKGNAYSVAAEQNGYIATYDDAKAFILGNLDRVSLWASHGIFNGGQISQATWKAAFPVYFDGINNPPENPELDYIDFRDDYNDVIMKMKGGSAQGIGALVEQEFDQFRRAVKAKLPQ